jgi:hypothetical protein
MRPYLSKLPNIKTAGGVAQGVGSEFKPQYCKKRKEKKTERLEGPVRLPLEGS